MAVHSMKDMPVDFLEGLYSALSSNGRIPGMRSFRSSTNGLPMWGPGAESVPEASGERPSFSLSIERIDVVPLRGNVDTRLRKLREQDLDGIILACAGVKRMGFAEQIREVLSFDMMVPPSGQGAIGIETRAETQLLDLLRPLNHEATMFEVSVERKLQALVGGGCSVPLGINASVVNGRIDHPLRLRHRRGRASCQAAGRRSPG